MLDKKTMSELIAIVLHGGADFAEVYAEYSKDNRISYADKKIETVANKIISGVGIRGFLGTRTFFASTKTVYLDIHLDCSYADFCTCYLEVHVA